MTESRQKRLHYKRAVVLGGNPRPLSSLILAAHARERRPLRRAWRASSDSEKVRLVNQCYASGEMVCGCLLEYSEGTFQAIVTLGEDELELAISQLPPGDREQFVEGMLFFGVQENHVVLLQSSSVRSAEFEAYLNWWLVARSGVLEEGCYVSLDNEPSRTVRAKLSGVRSVVLKTPLTPDTLRNTEQTPNHRGLTGAIKSQIWQIVNTEGTFGESVSAQEALGLEDIDLSIEIRRRGRGTEGPSLLDELAHTLRNVDGDLFEIQTRAGTIRGTELRLVNVRAIKTLNGVPQLADVVEKMRQYLADLLSSDLVSQEE